MVMKSPSATPVSPSFAVVVVVVPESRSMIDGPAKGGNFSDALPSPPSLPPSAPSGYIRT